MSAAKVTALLVLAFAACVAASGCGGRASAREPSVAAQRDVARRFAEAILAGRGDAAVSLLVRPHDAALSWLATRAAAPWRARRGSVRLPGRRSDGRWVFGYAGTHTHRDGSFEELRGDIAVVVKASRQGPGVSFFMLRDDVVRYGTHHDSVLLPSNR